MKGVLLVNLGTPDEPTTSAVRKYLSEFLSEETLNLLNEKYEAYIHDYHKSERKNRKLGHITHVCEDKDKLLNNINMMIEILQ